jgi:hypothetical protein
MTSLAGAGPTHPAGEKQKINIYVTLVLLPEKPGSLSRVFSFYGGVVPTL